MNSRNFYKYDNETLVDENIVLIQGLVCEKPEIDHMCMGENFYRMIVSVKRNSGVCDEIPVIISEKLFVPDIGERICIEGNVRTNNYFDTEGKKHLKLYVFATDSKIATFDEDINDVLITAIIVKPVLIRTTPMERKIADLLIAINRRYKKSSYVPCIAWGRIAEVIACWDVGTKIVGSGRFQSRIYQKEVNGVIEERTAYEISFSRVKKI